MNTIIGIDNGVTGSIAAIIQPINSLPIEIFFLPMPTKKEQSYTKKRQSITRIDYGKLYDILFRLRMFQGKCFIERPFANPMGFKATVSAMRALEATLIAVEGNGLAYEYIDSKEWQKIMLPAGIKGTAELKKASVDIGCRLFPKYAEAIRKHKDADSLLIAEWARRNR